MLRPPPRAGAHSEPIPAEPGESLVRIEPLRSAERLERHSDAA